MDRRQKTEDRKQSKNAAKLLKQRLPGSVFKIIRKIGKIAEDYGFSAYVVGGFVRDVLLGVENLDLDIVVEGDGLALVRLLQARIGLDAVMHRRFGTATVTLPDGFKVDIATARKEYYPCAACLPEVTFSSLREDLFRRDFTINTLALKINSANFGQLIDLFEAQQDLKERKIRVLHDRSFIDDPTRILRAIRFEQRFAFQIEPQTLRLMHQAITSAQLKKLSRFRLGRDFILFLKEENPLKAVLRFEQLCGLKLIHPGLKLDKSTLKKLKLAKAQDNWLVYFMLLTQPLKDGQLMKLCNDFSITKKDRNTLKALRAKKEF